MKFISNSGFTFIFKSICKNAIQAFDSIDQLKSIVNSLKESNNYDLILDNQIIENAYNICLDYKKRSDLINKKQNIYLIRRKVNKRKKFKTDSNENYYKNELKNMLNNEQIFGGTKVTIDKNIEVIILSYKYKIKHLCILKVTYFQIL